MKRPFIPQPVRQAVYHMFHGHCAYCGKPITYDEMEIDHIRPMNQGGGNALVNFFPSCHTCNKEKGCQPLSRWRHIRKEKDPSFSGFYFEKKGAMSLMKCHDASTPSNPSEADLWLPAAASSLPHPLPAKNHVRQVACFLQVESNVPFGIVENPNAQYILTSDGFYQLDKNDNKIPRPEILMKLITGQMSVYILPFRPETGSTYFYINDHGEVAEAVWGEGSTTELMRFAVRNCFPTQGSAEGHRKSVQNQLRRRYEESGKTLQKK